MNQKLIKKWLVAQVKLNSCDMAVRNLERQGFETFIPKSKVTIKRQNKFINKDEIVFPGYIFIGTDPQNFDWTKIKSTYGVSRLLFSNHKPSEISFNLILALKNKYEPNNVTTFPENLKKGDSVKFNNGLLVDLIAKVETLDSKNRIWLILETMGVEKKLKIKKTEKINFFKI